MRSKLLSLLFAFVTCLLAQSAMAQCSGPRYQQPIFDHYTVTTVTYSTVFNQMMDIYQPVGDSLPVRPLIVLAHGGSFTSGDRTDDSTIVWLCRDLATKGYVTVSIDYRLIDNEIELINADSAITEVLEAVSDGKAAVRYFYQDVYTNGNTYRIDTNNIFIGGNSAGAVLFMQYACIDSVAELPSNFQALLPAIGGTLDGNSGNPGYSSNFKGVISLAGGINQVSWMGYCSKPIVMAQGTADAIVPYTCGNPEDGVVPVTLCGLGSLAPNIVANTPYYDTMTFPGQGHVPWQNGGPMFTQVDTLVTGFLYHAVGFNFIAPCNTAPAPCATYLPEGIQSLSDIANIKLFPNPSSNVLNIQSSVFINEISMTDETGRTVVRVSDINTLNYQLNTTGLSPGIYFVQVGDGQGSVPAVRKVVIE